MYEAQQELADYIKSIEPIFAGKTKVVITALKSVDLFSDKGNNYLSIRVIPNTTSVDTSNCNQLGYTNANEMWIKFESHVNYSTVISRMSQHINKFFGTITGINTDAGELYKLNRPNYALKKDIVLIKIDFTLDNYVEHGCYECIEEEC